MQTPALWDSTYNTIVGIYLIQLAIRSSARVYLLYSLRLAPFHILSDNWLLGWGGGGIYECQLSEEISFVSDNLRVGICFYLLKRFTV